MKTIIDDKDVDYEDDAPLECNIIQLQEIFKISRPVQPGEEVPASDQLVMREAPPTLASNIDFTLFSLGSIVQISALDPEI